MLMDSEGFLVKMTPGVRPPQKVSGLCERRLKPVRQHFLVYMHFLLALKRCPIAAKIGGSIGILPRCVFHIYRGIHERLPDL